MSRQHDYARRKALLVTQAEIDRTRLAMATRQLRWEILPPRTPGNGQRSAFFAQGLVGLALPLFGASRGLRVIRILSLALAAYRVASRIAGRRP